MLALPESAIPSAAGLAARFAEIRAASLALSAPLSDEDCAAQSMPDASPVKWHLAHTSWFFETFLLEAFEPGFTPFHPAFRMLFNSYYNGIGEKFSRPQRGLLTRPSRAEILAYRANVDARMLALLHGDMQAEALSLVELGLQHEQQHQELILTDVQHLLSINPLCPAYSRKQPAPHQPVRGWQAFEGGITTLGHTGEAFHFDNEAPRHRHFLEPYELAADLVTNAQYRAFIEDGGYNEPSFWLSEGWSALQAEARTQPLYWRRIDGRWHEFTLSGLIELEPDAPARCLSYFEASAYAQWAGARLPTEAEWEHAATQHPSLPNLFGTAWQWTSSAYAPYPGFTAQAGAVGEYNGKFMVNQYVLRGSSSATPPGHSRSTYRNFFPAYASWQFTGIRLARSLS